MPFRFEVNTMRDPSGDQIGLLSAAASAVSLLDARRRRSKAHTPAFPPTLSPHSATYRPSRDIAGFARAACTGSPAFSISRPERSNQINCCGPDDNPTPNAPRRYATAPVADTDT